MSIFKERLPWELPESVWDHLLLMDVEAWDTIAGMEVIRYAIDSSSKYGSDLTPEAFLGLYNSAAVLQEISPDGLEIVHALMERANNLPDWNELRRLVDGDEVAAAFGAASFATELVERLPEDVKKKLEKSAGNQEWLNRLVLQMEELQELVEVPGMPRDDIQAKINELTIDAANAKEQTNNALAASTKAMNKAQAQIENAMVQSIVESSAALADIKGVAKSIGLEWGVGPGTSAGQEQIKELGKLAQYLKASESLRNVMRYLGWARKMVNEEKRKSRHGRDKFTHYRTQALNLEDLAPQEYLGLLAPPNTIIHLDFIARAAEDDLLHMMYEGEEDSGDGPIVFVSDTSQSMRGPRSTIRAAIELAMMTHALKAKRRFVSIPFSGTGQFKIFDPGQSPSPEDLVKHVEFGYWGGTEPYAPLEAAIEIIQEDASMRRGDICVLTDGAFAAPPDGFMEKLRAAREEPGVKIAALVISTYPGHANFADKVVLADDLVADKEKWGNALSVFF